MNWSKKITAKSRYSKRVLCGWRFKVDADSKGQSPIFSGYLGPTLNASLISYLTDVPNLY